MSSSPFDVSSDLLPETSDDIWTSKVRGVASASLPGAPILATRHPEVDSDTGWRCFPFSGGASLFFLVGGSGIPPWRFSASLSWLLHRMGAYSERVFWFAVLLRLPICRLPILILLGFVPGLRLHPVLSRGSCELSGLFCIWRRLVAFVLFVCSFLISCFRMGIVLGSLRNLWRVDLGRAVCVGGGIFFLCSVISGAFFFLGRRGQRREAGIFNFYLILHRIGGI